mmetsp:Transcript_33847/g.73231  ORF Transcript_33847/g.73231 Transcript_33847/m.73231 type:complete len:249 (-) Transcript_33847:1843-2589(-)
MVQILLVQRLDIIPRVLVQDPISRQQRRAIVGDDAIHGETPGQTRDAPERSLERLLQVMGVVILEHLNHGHPRAGLVVHLRLSTKRQHLLLLVHSVHHVRDGHGIHAGVGIDGHQESHHVRLQIQIHHGTLYRRVELSQLPPVVDAIVVPHNDQLGVALTAIPRLRGRLGLLGQTHLRDGDVLEELVSLLQYAVVDPRAILGVQHADAVVLEGVVLELVDVESQNVRQVIGRAHVLAVPRDQAVGHHE